jgi:hypothetical protein
MAEDEIGEDLLEKLRELSDATLETKQFLAAHLHQLDYDQDREVFTKLYAHLSALRESPSWKGFWHSSIAAPESNWQVAMPLSKMVSRKDEVVWFLVDLPLLSYWPVFEGTVESIEWVTKARQLFEYYVISKELDWVIAKSRHDEVYVAGAVTKVNGIELKGISHREEP